MPPMNWEKLICPLNRARNAPMTAPIALATLLPKAITAAMPAVIAAASFGPHAAMKGIAADTASVAWSVSPFSAGVKARPSVMLAVSRADFMFSIEPLRLLLRMAPASAAVVPVLSLSIQPVIPAAPSPYKIVAAESASLPNRVTSVFARC